PTWAVTDDVLVTAFNPQTAMAAVQFGGGFENSNVVRRLADLAEGNTPVFASYADLPTMTPHTYPALLLLMQGGVGAGDLFGEYLRTRPPGFVMPTLPDVQSNVTPSMAVAWMDEDGLHSRSVEPFPLSGVLVDYGKSYATINQMMTQVAFSAGVMMPSLSRAREAAQKVKSASNLRSIGQGLVMHSIDDVRASRFPDDLTGIARYDVPGIAFVSPVDEPETVPLIADEEWIAAQDDYIYLGSGLTGTSPPSTIIAVENPEAVAWNDGINVLYADGAVRFVPLYDLERSWQEHLRFREKRGAPMDEATKARMKRLFGF
ncbi:MAG: H-X9-DG-CTERM domain-containing protein, partial [Planctomycetota bacterium]